MRHDPAAAATTAGPATLASLVERVVAGVPRWRRARIRRELIGYLEDALADLLAEGYSPDQAVAIVRARFGDPDLIATSFRNLPPPRLAREVRRTVPPLGVAVLGLVLGLALVQARMPASTEPAGRPAHLLAAATPDEADLSLLHVRQVDRLHAPGVPITQYQVTARLGLVRTGSPPATEPTPPVLTPGWLPDGYHPGRGQVLRTASTTVQYFPDERGRPGIVVEVLQPDRSTVFQVKERHVFPVRVDGQPGFYIDGEWEVRGPQDEQPAPAAWRTDRSHSLLFSRDGLLVLVAGPADVLDVEGLLRIARSLR